MLRISSDFERAVLISGEEVSVRFYLRCEGDCTHEGLPYMKLTVGNREELYLFFDTVKVEPGSTLQFTCKFKVLSVRGEGVLGFYFEEKGVIVAKREYPVYVAEPGDPIYVAFVWHHHQAPQFHPDGTFKDLWAYTHVLQGSFYKHSGGPYLVHVDMHLNYNFFRDVDHFSPSLLEQWAMLLDGSAKVPAEIQSKRSVVESLLSNLRELVKSGRVEPLASVYAHTVLGFILRKAKEKGLSEAVRRLIVWELEQGFDIVERVLGKRPLGVWTPEMFWSMELVDIYASLGVKYTVLCEQHFAKAGGEKATIYEPYIVRDPSSSSELVVFFRDLSLSNWLSFNVDFKDEEEADLAARRFVVELAKRREAAPGGIVVVALDGENWMIMPSYRKYAPLFLERILEYIGKSGLILTTTLERYLETHAPKRVLTYVPQGSWIDLSDKQWVGGPKDEAWEKAFRALAYVNSLYEALGEHAMEASKNRDTELFKALRALAISMDSDFYWYGEVEKERAFVEEWAEEALNIVGNFVKSNLSASIEVGGEARASLILSNSSNYSIQVRVSLISPNYKNEAKVVLEPGSRRTIPIYTPAPGNTKVEVKAGEITLASFQL